MTSPETNSLFGTLALYTRLYHRPLSKEELTHGLPTAPGASSPAPFTAQFLNDNFEKAAARAGLRSKLVQKKLGAISPLTLPAILLLHDGSACILDEVAKDGKSFRVMLEEAGDAPRWIDSGKLADQYSGHAYLLAEVYRPAEREQALLARDKGHWLWSALRLSFPLYRDIVLASAVVNLFVILTPMFTMNVYDRVVPNNAIDTLWVLAIGILVVMVLDSVLRLMRTHFIEVAAKKSDIVISSRIFEKLMDLRMDEAPRNIGAFSNSLREFDTIRNFLTSTVVLVLVDLPFTVFFLIATWLLAGKLVFIPLSLIGVLLLYSALIKYPLKNAVASAYEDTARKNSLLVESIGGLADIKQMNAAGLFQWRWENLVGEVARKGIRARLLSMSNSTLTQFLVQVDSVLVIVYGVHLIQAQELTLGGLIAASILASRSITPMGQLVALMSNYEQAHEAYKSLGEIMRKPSEKPAGVEFLQKDSLEGEIEFRELSFTYPGSERVALRDVSFKIRKGEKVGILGKTGSGKSTVHKLLMGFYRPQKGLLLLDGLDITQLSPVLVRDSTACVPQEFTLFGGTLKDNIRLGSPTAPDDAVLEAVKTGGLQAYVEAHPRGLEAPVDQRGGNLSGGQRQGVIIARAFLEDHPIVLLDEPTSAMDGGTELIVMEALRKKVVGRTMIMTTHKNNFLDILDRVIVLDGGRVVFDGTRDDFVKKYLSPGGRG